MFYRFPISTIRINNTFLSQVFWITVCWKLLSPYEPNQNQINYVIKHFSLASKLVIMGFSQLSFHVQLSTHTKLVVVALCCILYFTIVYTVNFFWHWLFLLTYCYYLYLAKYPYMYCLCISCKMVQLSIKQSIWIEYLGVWQLIFI